MGDSGTNKNKNEKNLSGVQKYSRKMRERDQDYTYSAPFDSGRNGGGAAANSGKNTASGRNPSGNTSSGSGNSSSRVRTVHAKTGAARKSKQRLVREKDKSRKEKKNSRFSTHGKAAIIAVFAVLFIVVTVFAGLLSYTYLVDRTESQIYVDEIELDEATTVKFKIEKGMKTAQIVEKLEEMELIKNGFLFKLLSKFNGYDSMYKSGVHYLSKGLTYDEIMTILSSQPLVTKVTFPEGFTTVQIAERLEASNVCKAQDFLKAVNSVDVSSYGFLPKEKGDRDYLLDGYLFPDTYEFEIDSAPDTVVYKLLNRFNDLFKIEYLARIEKLGLTVDQVINLAAIVEKEAYLDSERSTIAGVYYNRIFSEELPLLQSDATVIYALRRNGNDVQRIVTEDRQFDDPYNTYIHPGLPPGPICNPSEASIKAVITMNKHDYYFYVLKNDGSGGHIFSKTFEEHKAAIEAMQGD
ncbi:MAG: endolytic transglycosylase MltG [Clostridia bacterium]|nr:endolytic transglycosylase MltG [Clostridia bacterium]